MVDQAILKYYRPSILKRQNYNRKSVWEILLVTMLVITIMTGSILFYLWSRIKVLEFNYTILENSRIEKILTEENKDLRLKLAMLTSPSRLATIAQNNFHLKYPTQEQIIYVK